MITGSIAEGADWFWEGSAGHWVVLLTLPAPPRPSGLCATLKCDKFSHEIGQFGGN